MAGHSVPVVRGHAPPTQGVLGGRAIAITGVRGGVGATTIAVNLAWNFGVGMRRHSVLLDPDIYLGSAAFLLNIQPGSGLRLAMEAPERLDSLLADSVDYAAKLRENGTTVELVIEPGLVHAAVRARALAPAVADAWRRYCAAAARLAGAPDDAR